jgi:hypothetical protein
MREKEKSSFNPLVNVVAWNITLTLAITTTLFIIVTYNRRREEKEEYL